MNSLDQKLDNSISESPFGLQNESAYSTWRAQKLDNYPNNINDILINIKDISSLSEDEYRALIRICQQTNMVLYATAGDVAKEAVRALGQQLGLTRLDPNMLADDDGITSLQVVDLKNQRGYIPYSDKRLLWHTDGYYNKPQQTIRAFILHCVQAASSGGDNALVDPEMVYLMMRDHNPAFIEAMMHPRAMTIPANAEAPGEARAEQTGPVFSIDPNSGRLHMRYTARTRSITWRDDPVTSEAVAWIDSFLNDNENLYVFRHKLTAGQGLICNNVLHSRTSFSDSADKARLLYRARYYDRIRDTGLPGP